MAEEKLKLLQITLYGEDDEVKASYSRSFVPWAVLKMAVRISKTLDINNPSEEDIDALAGLVVEAFGGQFSVDELSKGADISEMLAVMTTIIAKAQLNMPANPTQPQG